MAVEDFGAKAAVGAGALGLLLSEAGAVSGPLVGDSVLAGAIAVGAFVALLSNERGD